MVLDLLHREKAHSCQTVASGMTGRTHRRILGADRRDLQEVEHGGDVTGEGEPRGVGRIDSPEDETYELVLPVDHGRARVAVVAERRVRRGRSDEDDVVDLDG